MQGHIYTSKGTFVFVREGTTFPSPKKQNDICLKKNSEILKCTQQFYEAKRGKVKKNCPHPYKHISGEVPAPL